MVIFVEIPKKLFDLDALCFLITEPVRYALTHMPANKTPRVYASFLLTRSLFCAFLVFLTSFRYIVCAKAC